MNRLARLALGLIIVALTAWGGVAPASGAVFFFENNSGITINDAAAATPFPSTINVAGVIGTVTHITVGIVGLSHTFPDDVEIIVSSPGGQSVTLMSDAGGGTDVLNATLAFSDCALRIVPTGSQIVSGRFRPSNYGGADAIPVPGPDDPATTLAVFNGGTVNGTWNLFVSDDAGGDSGGIAGWNLTIFTDAGGLPAGLNPVPCGKPDFDGDGRADTVVYQQTTGNWFAVGSGIGFFNVALGFGGSGFTPVAGDYDGDGITDAAVYQASTGNWFAVGSSTGFFNVALGFGGAGFTPVPGDYDGDGETDPAVYQASTGNWFVVGSTDGFSSVLGFGGSGFTPVQAAQ